MFKSPKFRFFITLTALNGFIIATLPAAHSGELYDPHANFGHQSEISGGFYLKIPFNGRLRRASNNGVRFGLALKATMPQTYSYAPINFGYSFQGSANNQIKLLDLSIGSKGFKSFQLNGHSFAEINALYADEEGGGKKKVWPWIFGAVVVGVAIGAIVYCSGDKVNINDQIRVSNC